MFEISNWENAQVKFVGLSESTTRIKKCRRRATTFSDGGAPSKICGALRAFYFVGQRDCPFVPPTQLYEWGSRAPGDYSVSPSGIFHSSTKPMTNSTATLSTP